MTILNELVCVTGEYQAADGTVKKRWRTVGHLHSSQDGREYITLDPLVNLAAIPRRDGDDRVYANLFEPKEKTGAPKAKGAKPFPDDDITF